MNKLAILVLALVPVSGAIAGAGDGFIRHRSLDPLSATFGLPEVAARPDPGSGELQLSFEHGSIFTGGRTATETLTLDGETSRLALRYNRSLGGCLEFGVAGEAVVHAGGLFDSSIDDWHQWFGLPDAGRDQVPADLLDYSYENAAGEGFTLNRSAQGPGDINVSLARGWHCNDNAGPLMRLGLKLPTGSSDSLLGSGTTDAFADVQAPWLSAGLRWRFSASGGILIPGQVDDYPEQRTLVGYGSAAAVFRFNETWHAVAQLDGRTAFFDSPLRELGNASLVLTTGVRALRANDDAFEISIAEDVAIETAHDIVLRLGWTHAL